MARDSNSDYTVVDVQWRSAKLTLQIVKVPEEKIPAKLATLDAVSGISKIEFYHFLIGKCLIDQERVSRHIAITSSTPETDAKLVEEVALLVIQVNPLLNPGLMAISEEGAVVLLADDESSTRLLVDNPLWNQSMDDLMSDFQEFMEDSSLISSGYGVEKVLWEEVGLEVPILKLDGSEEQLSEFFAKRSKFSAVVGYKAYVIQNAIIDFHNTVLQLEQLGVSQEMSTTEMSDKLFALVLDVNPSLSLDAISESFVEVKRGPAPPKPTRRSRVDPNNPPTTLDATASAAMPAGKKTTVRDFASVPTEELRSLATRIQERVVGQQEAVQALCETLQVAGAGLRDPEKPLGSFLLTGETGVGKTLLAKVLSEKLVGSAQTIVRIDCSEYSHSHEISKLIGAPAGYLGHDAGGQLTNKIIQTPFSVVLFDEIEKAHSKLYDILLQILDEGRLTDGKGATADFSDCVILLTSNIGVRDVSKIGKTVGFGDAALMTHGKKTAAITGALKRHFKPEFLNRLDGVLTFNALSKEDGKKIVHLSFKEVCGYLESKNVRLEPSDALVNHLLDVGFSPEYGARALKRQVESLVIRPLAIKMLAEKALDNCKVLADFVDDTVVFSFEPLKKPKVKRVEVSTSEIFR